MLIFWCTSGESDLIKPIKPVNSVPRSDASQPQSTATGHIYQYIGEENIQQYVASLCRSFTSTK